MKNLFYTTVVILAMLISCETQEELIVIPDTPTLGKEIVVKPDTISPSKPDSISVLKPDSVPASKPDSAVQPSPPIVTTPPVVMPPADPVPAPEPIVVTPPSVPTTPVTNPGTDKFNIIYSLTFDKNTLGSYKESEWKIDWKNPTWANHKYGYGKIAQEGTNKYLMLPHYAGSFGAVEGYQWHGKFSSGYDELYLSYRVKFSTGFSTQKLDGKLPGLSGGSSNGGGNIPDGKDGWSGRYMFKGMNIKFYVYSPDMYKIYGDSYPISGKKYYGYGPYLDPGYTFKPNVWYTVTQRIVMNTVGKSDGIVEGYINGKLCAVITGIRFRDVSTLKIDRIYFANFFGGSGNPPSTDEAISFDDFYVYTYSSSVNIARGNVANPTGTTIILPNQ